MMLDFEINKFSTSFCKYEMELVLHFTDFTLFPSLNISLVCQNCLFASQENKQQKIYQKPNKPKNKQNNPNFLLF